MEEYVAEYSYSEGSERTPLSTADQEDWNPPDNDQGNPPKKTIYFRFGSRIVEATGAQSDWHHPNVLRLQVQPSIISRLIQVLLLIFPFAWIRDRFPEWTLPRNIVLKIKKPDWDREFKTEAATYALLQPLQGKLIPKLHGQIAYDGTRALILSDIGGACLATPEGAVLRPEELRPLLETALTTLADHGVSHDDIKLDNFHLVSSGRGEKIMAVDLERVDVGLSQEDRDIVLRANVDQLVRWYRGHLECLKEDGVLLPPKYPAPVS